jgi:translation initiation factor IF-3
LEKARDASLDLVEVARNAKPPVVKIVDFKKFKYEENKKERVARKKTREIDTKEIWLSPTISDHDLEIRLSRARHFLGAGDKVKLTVKFAGRQIIHPELGRNILDKALDNLSEIAEKDSEPKMAGRALSINIRPIKK